VTSKGMQYERVEGTLDTKAFNSCGTLLGTLCETGGRESDSRYRSAPGM
jgi:hypothetical protein